MYNNIFKTLSYDQYLDLAETAKTAHANNIAARAFRALAALFVKPVHA